MLFGPHHLTLVAVLTYLVMRRLLDIENPHARRFWLNFRTQTRRTPNLAALRHRLDLAALACVVVFALTYAASQAAR